MTVLVLLAFVLAIVALIRSSSAEQQAREARSKVSQLEAELTAWRAGLAQTNLPTQTVLPQPPIQVSTPPATPAHPAPPVWPEDVPAPPTPVTPFTPAPAAPPMPRGPSLWGPEFSRARISVIGGALVLGGLAFTLHALGLPQWTLLLAVFAFGALLYGTARLVPWPVSGALRGLGYGVVALGVGSLAQKLPDAWGPGVVLLGLLLLSAALTWDSLRRREPLLGVLAAGGATLSVWILADDLGRTSILSAGTVFLLIAAALAGGQAHLAKLAQAKPTPEGDPDTPETWRAAAALLLGLAGLLPLGWLVASLSHVVHRAFENTWTGGKTMLSDALYVPENPLLGLLAWAVFGLLALTPAFVLLKGRSSVALTDALLRLGAAWATLLPQALVALAVGAAISQNARDLPVVGAALVLVGALVGAAWWAWQQTPLATDLSSSDTADPEHSLAGTLAGSLTASASGVAGAILVSLVGARTEPAVLAGLALVLLLVGVYGHSRLWLGLGAVGLVLTAWWGALLPTSGLLWSESALAGWWRAALSALPAGIGLLGVWRLVGRPAPLGELPSWLAGLCSAALIVALGNGPLWLLLGGTLLLGGAVWAAFRAPDKGTAWLRPLFWAGLPGLLLGGWLLLAEVTPEQRWLPLLGSLLAALTLLLTARPAARGQPLIEGVALTLLTLTLGLILSPHWASLTLPLALTTLLAALLPLRLPALRVEVLLLLGGLSAVQDLLWHLGDSPPRPLEFLGAVLLLGVWWLTRHPAGQDLLRRPWPAARLNALTPQADPVRAWWLAALLGLSVTAGQHLSSSFQPWLMLLASAAVLLVGLQACISAHQQGVQPFARSLWTAGLSLIVVAGLKAALMDAFLFSNVGAVAGMSVLITGLSLLLVAIFAPRPTAPAAPEPAEASPVPPPPR